MPETRSRIDTRAHLHYGICRYCWGTGEAVKEAVSRVTCPECEGVGALA